MANWNDSENLSLPGLTLFITLSLLIPGAITVFLAYRVAPSWQTAYLYRFTTSGIVEHRAMATNPNTGLPALTARVVYHIGDSRFHCEEWHVGQIYLEDSASVDSLFFEAGSAQNVYYQPGNPENAMLQRRPPKKILILTLVTLVIGIPGLLLPLITGSRHWRNSNSMGSAAATFILFWTWGLAVALVWYMPQIERQLAF